MAKSAPGTVKEAKIVKAGCGLRYDPDALGEEVGFDFSKVEAMKELLEEAENNKKDQEDSN